MARRTKHELALERLRDFVENHTLGQVWYSIDHGTLRLTATPQTTDRESIIAAAERFSKTLDTLGLKHGHEAHFSGPSEIAELASVGHVLRGEAIKKAAELVPELRPSPSFAHIWLGGPKPKATTT